MSELTRRGFIAGSAALGSVALGVATADSAWASTKADVSLPITVTPADAQYVDLARGTNQRFVGAPQYVELVSTTSQVITAVRNAVRAGKRIAVRSGGHCFEGFVTDAAVQVVIDLSPMRAVYFDSSRNSFLVEAGATLGEVYDTLYKRWGVTLPGGVCPTVGIGGHITGGGYGALSRKFGLTVDHLEAIEVVTVDASGAARATIASRASNDPNRELWWAHAGGGGGNFGIVTKFWFRTPGVAGADPSELLPTPPRELLLSRISWNWADIDEARFGRLMSNFSRWYERNSSPTSRYNGLYSELAVPHRVGGGIGLVTQIDGTLHDADRLLDDYLSEINAGVGNSYAVADRRRVPWLHATKWGGITGPLDPTMAFKSKMAYLRKEFPPEQIAAMFRNLTRTDYSHPTALLLLSGYGGAVNRVRPDATAVAQRDSIIKIQTAAIWSGGEDETRHLNWVRETYRDIYSESGGVPVPNDVNDGLYINYADVDVRDPRWNTSGVPWSQLYYKENYSRLQAVKARWDPANVFRHALSVERRSPGSATPNS